MEEQPPVPNPEKRTTSRESRAEYQDLRALIEDGRCTAKELRDAFRQHTFTFEQERKLLFLAFEEAEKRAQTDTLTGLFNRASFDSAIAKVRETLDGEQSKNLSVMIVYLDVKKMKTINDTHGHDAGDQALVITAHNLRESTKKGKDILFRVGGDEFIAIMLISDDNVRTLKAIFERMKSEMNDNLSVNTVAGLKVPFEVSMGYSVLQKDDSTTTEELLRVADKKMYRDKVADSE